MGLWERQSKRAATALAITFMTTAIGTAAAAPPSNPPPAAPKSYHYWSGVWEGVKGTPYWGFTSPPRPAGEPPLPNAGAACLPMGMPGMMMMLYLMETFALPDQLTIASEDQSVLRRIYIDGRDHPKGMWPTYTGHSIGHWEGDVLVVDTVGIRTDTTFNGRAHSDALHVTEKMRLVDANTFEDAISAEDPKSTEKNWATVKRYARQPKGTEINEFVCEENNRNPPDANGQPTFKSP